MNITPTTRQKRYFLAAKQSSLNSTYKRLNRPNGCGRVSIGSVIVNGNYIVSKGHNKIKTHPFQQLHNHRSLYQSPSPRIHAEIDALIYSRYNDLTSCEIFVYRQNMDGSLGDCNPCKACRNALKDAGIKHLYYTTNEGYCYERT